MNRKIRFNSGWSVVPPGIVGSIAKKGKPKPGLLSQFNLAEAKLYFVLADACKYEAEVRVSNAALEEATGLDGKSLRRARASLTDGFKVIYSKPADGRKESYVYSVVKSARSTNPVTMPDTGFVDPIVVIVPIPDAGLKQILSPIPSLEGKSKQEDFKLNLPSVAKPRANKPAPSELPIPVKPVINPEYLPKVGKKPAKVDIES